MSFTEALVSLEVVQAGDLQIGCNDSDGPMKLMNSFEGYAGIQKSICQAKDLHVPITFTCSTFSD